MMFSQPKNCKMYVFQAVIFLCRIKIDPLQLRELFWASPTTFICSNNNNYLISAFWLVESQILKIRLVNKLDTFLRATFWILIHQVISAFQETNGKQRRKGIIYYSPRKVCCEIKPQKHTIMHNSVAIGILKKLSKMQKFLISPSCANGKSPWGAISDHLPRTRVLLWSHWFS